MERGSGRLKDCYYHFGIYQYWHKVYSIFVGQGTAGAAVEGRLVVGKG